MKSFVAILALVAVAAADVSHIVGRSDESQAVIEQQSADVFPDQYSYILKTSNGISAQESGTLTQYGQNKEPALSVQGANQHTAPDGQVISLTYTADDNGYHPVGSHLPTPPPPQPIPDYILRAIAYTAANPPKPESTRRF